MKATIGEIVHYKNVNGNDKNVYAAVVTKVNEPDMELKGKKAEETVDLTVFAQGQELYQTRVRYSAELEPGHWSGKGVSAQKHHKGHIPE